MKTFGFRTILLAVCCNTLIAGELLAQAPIPDILDLKLHPTEFKESEDRARKFSRRFKTDKANALDYTTMEVSYDSLLKLKAKCVENPTGIDGRRFIYGLAIHYGLSDDRKSLEYFFEPVICVKTSRQPDVERSRTYDLILSRGYYRYRAGRFVAATRVEMSNAFRNYEDFVRINRNGTGIIYRPFGKHCGTRLNDNARSILFPFQEIEEVFDDNTKRGFAGNTLQFFSASQRDDTPGPLNKQKHHMIISTKKPGDSAKGPFVGKAANLGSICPVNCDYATFQLAQAQ